MGSVFGKLFGGFWGRGRGGAPAADAVEYNGYKIVPAPQAGGQWLTAGTITKEIGGESKSTSSFARFPAAGTTRSRFLSPRHSRSLTSKRRDLRR